MSSVLKTQKQVDENLTAIFRKRFELDSEQNKDNPGYQAWGLEAIEVALAMANMVLAIKRPDSGRGFRMAKDLTYGLNANNFWVKNAPVLMPLVTTMLNAHADELNIAMDVATYREYSGYDALLSSTKCASLELFSMILYLVGGPLLMAVSSTPLKLDLMPYFVSV
jgi:hypothetical protein